MKKCGCVVSPVREAAEMEQILRYCDAAFADPVCERENFSELLQKITMYAEFLAARDPRVMGYAAMYANDQVGRTAYITLIAVHPDFQGQGVGHALIEACVRVAKDRGMTAIKLEVRCDNTAAIRLYEAHGFVPTEDSGKPDRRYMIKTL